MEDGRAEEAEMGLQRGRETGSQGLFSKRGMTNSRASRGKVESAERSLLELTIRHQAGARWPGTCRLMGSLFRLLEPSVRVEQLMT